MSIRLYVGNLPKENIERQTLEELFIDAGETISIKVIKERKTGKCRGFAFVTVLTDELADAFIEKYNGVILSGKLKKKIMVNLLWKILLKLKKLFQELKGKIPQMKALILNLHLLELKKALTKNVITGLRYQETLGMKAFNPILVGQINWLN